MLYNVGNRCFQIVLTLIRFLQKQQKYNHRERIFNTAQWRRKKRFSVNMGPANVQHRQRDSTTYNIVCRKGWRTVRKVTCLHLRLDTKCQLLLSGTCHGPAVSEYVICCLTMFHTAHPSDDQHRRLLLLLRHYNKKMKNSSLSWT